MDYELKSQIISRLRLIIKIGVLVTLFTPLIIGPFSFSFSDFPKILFFKTIVTFCFLVYLVLIWLDPKRYLPSFNLLGISLLFYLLVLIIGTVNSFNIHRSFWGSLEQVFGLVNYIYYVLYFILVIVLFASKNNWLGLLRVMVAVGGLTSLAGIGQRLGVVDLYNVHDLADRVSGTLSNPDYFAVYLNLVIGFGFLLFFLESRRLLKSIWLLISGLNIVVLVLTGSRGAWLGLLSGFIIFCLLYFWFRVYERPLLRRKILFLGLFFSVLLFFCNLGILNSSLKDRALVQRFYSLFDIRTLTENSRMKAWETAWAGFKEKPLRGWGLLSFNYVFEKFFRGEYGYYIPVNITFYQPHNFILEVMSDLGLLGVFSYLAIFFSATWLVITSKSRGQEGTVGIFCLSLLGVYFVQSLLLFNTPSAYLLFILILALTHTQISKHSNLKIIRLFQKQQDRFVKEDGEGSVKRSNKYFTREIKIVGIILVGLFLLFIWYESGLKPLLATQYFVKGIRLESTNFNQALSLYTEGIDKHYTVYHKKLYQTLVARCIKALEDSNRTISKDQLISEMSRVNLYLVEALEQPDISPITSYNLVAKVYEQIYLYTKNPTDLMVMERIATEALALYDQRPHFYDLLGRVRIYQGDIEQGELYLQQAFRLSYPRTLQDHINFYKTLGYIYYLNAEPELALDNFNIAINLIYNNHISHINTNTNKGIIEVDPRLTREVASFFKDVAVIYYRSGDFNHAKEVVNKAIQIYPEHQDWLKKVLLELERKQQELKAKNEGELSN